MSQCVWPAGWEGVTVTGNAEQHLVAIIAAEKCFSATCNYYRLQIALMASEAMTKSRQRQSDADGGESSCDSSLGSPDWIQSLKSCGDESPTACQHHASVDWAAALRAQPAAGQRSGVTGQLGASSGTHGA